MIEAAWHSRHKPAVGPGLRKRRQGQPAWVIAQADRAMSRLHRRFYRLSACGKPYNKVVAAVARELVGFVWGGTSGRHGTHGTAAEQASSEADTGTEADFEDARHGSGSVKEEAAHVDGSSRRRMHGHDPEDPRSNYATRSVCCGHPRF